ncbi:uncharacterized protein LOC126666401 [Mercurialis annua]|uniref:uncharacterized protein LOC126666401 n=1 Tax=Mercurialis annua TaxID=3986 RepID=UPI00215ED137|nr:uncharacterized protein LOC126666401 [Mercurialis annua]
MDRNWINHKGISDRRKPDYIKGVNEFLDFSFIKVGRCGKIRCPCNICMNGKFQTRESAFNHLIVYGILTDYRKWSFHGEESDEELEDDEDDLEVDETIKLVHDVTNVRASDFTFRESEMCCENIENDVPEKFSRLMNDADKELFPGCKNFSKLEFILHLLHIKCINSWSDKSFTMLLTLLKKVFLHDETFPHNSYEAKKYMRDLGLNYNKIHACKNDCILYRKNYANAESCHVCGCSRWKSNEDKTDIEKSKAVKGKKIPNKVLRHFPLIPRLQRLYMSSKLACHMRWHKEKRCDDGILRHPADSKAWKTVDQTYPNFSSDPRNIRLGLSTDGFNPFGNLSTSYSIWPVIVVPYNLPPWMSMKSDFLMLSLLIPGDKAPGNNIDIYLEPLIEELEELWEVGVEFYDAFSSTTFSLHAVLLWTISDFPAYAKLSGWSTKGKLACPSCNINTCSLQLKHCHKFCYMGHRRFLEANHKWRFDKKSFDGNVETRAAPKQLSGDDILRQWHGCENIVFGKLNKKIKGKRKNQSYEHELKYNWKKKSIFFRLPYWSKLLIRHNLDVMHIEKNICDSILGTLMGIVGKSKDTVNSRIDKFII